MQLIELTRQFYWQYFFQDHLSFSVIFLWLFLELWLLRFAPELSYIFQQNAVLTSGHTCGISHFFRGQKIPCRLLSQLLESQLYWRWVK